MYETSAIIKYKADRDWLGHCTTSGWLYFNMHVHIWNCFYANTWTSNSSNTKDIIDISLPHANKTFKLHIVFL